MNESTWGLPSWSSTWERAANTPTKKNDPTKTSKEFAELDTENMSKEELLKHLNNALLALEEAEVAWTEEHEKRVEAEVTVEELREAGFTGGETVAESVEDDSNDLSYWPKVTVPRSGITYNTPSNLEAQSDAIKALRQQLEFLRKRKY